MANYEATRYNFNGSNLSGIEGINTGVIVPWTSSSVPSGFLECNGANVSRSTYSDLFAGVGTTYGAGDGSSTFTLPDLQDNVVVGKSGTKSLASTMGANTVAGAGTLSVANHTLSLTEMASHAHPGAATSPSPGFRSGNPPQMSRFSSTGDTGNAGGGGGHNHNATFSGTATSVLQPYIAVLYIIKT